MGGKAQLIQELVFTHSSTITNKTTIYNELQNCKIKLPDEAKSKIILFQFRLGGANTEGNGFVVQFSDCLPYLPVIPNDVYVGEYVADKMLFEPTYIANSRPMGFLFDITADGYLTLRQIFTKQMQNIMYLRDSGSTTMSQLWKEVNTVFRAYYI